jgi:hypothetical protein
MSCCGGLPSWLDCSPAAQDERKRQLKNLMAKAYSGVATIADRGRSVSHVSAADMKPLIDELKKEIGQCDGTYRGRHSLKYIDQVKGL